MGNLATASSEPWSPGKARSWCPSTVDNCHQLTITKKRNKIPNRCTLHNQCPPTSRMVTYWPSPRKGTRSPTGALFTTNVLRCRELLPTDRHQKKGTRSPPALERVTSAKCLGGRVVREPPLGEAHPLNCCKSQQSERLRIQEPEGMLFRHTATEAFVRPCSVRARIRGVGHPSAISEIHIGDGATTISSYHPSWL